LLYRISAICLLAAFVPTILLLPTVTATIILRARLTGREAAGGTDADATVALNGSRVNAELWRICTTSLLSEATERMGCKVAPLELLDPAWSVRTPEGGTKLRGQEYFSGAVAV
jgi:hypothetical protein